ncbi:BTAD domain-containing putative transcriptional regulator [Crossiella equi]|uniref:BTAD domain-containing putative transcriptional regulator n=1 Tax=Crossiella equi TaxID=130796 RepID=UPI000A397C57|nr:BTAD domain-containing putative transcriptional regulator [Crossiella equi]
MYLRLLGTVELLDDHGGRVEVTAPKRRAVLAVLGVRLNHVVPVDTLVRAAWGEAPPVNGVAALQTHVWALRKLLDPTLSLRTESAGYALCGAGDTTDHARFLALVESARTETGTAAVRCLTDALGLWRGEPLSGVPRTDALAALAQDLEELRLTAVEDLAEGLLALHRPTEALALLTPERDRHPFRESLLRLLVVAYSHSGQQARAIRTYHRVREQLSSELGVDPSPLLRGAFEEILRGSAPPPVRSAPSVAVPEGLLGRDAELARLRAFTHDLGTGRGGVARLTGEAGIGKSTLVEALLPQARAGGIRVCAGAAERLEEDLPFAALSGALGLTGVAEDPDVAEIVATLRGRGRAGLANATRHEVEVLVTGLLSALVEKWCTRTPVLLVLEDFQWADEASALVVHLLGRATALMPLGLLVTARTGPARDRVAEALAALADRPRAVLLDLPPLPGPVVYDLAARLIGAKPGQRLRALLARAAGNPLYLTELVRGLIASDSLLVGEGTAEPVGDSLPLPESLRTAVRRHLRLLSQSARDLVHTAAALGASCALPELAALCPLPETALAAAVGEAVAAGVLREGTPGQLLFRHDLVRQAALAALSQAEVGGLHHRIAHLLRELGAPAERVLAHLAASPLLDAPCVDWLAEHAKELIVRRSHLAIGLLTRSRLAVHLALALMWSGRLREADRAVREAMGVVLEPDPRAELSYLLTRTALFSGQPDEALRHAELTLDAESPGAEVRRRLECMRAIALNSLGRSEEAWALATRVLPDARQAQDHTATVYLKYLIGGIELMRGHLTPALETIDRGLRAAALAPVDPFTMLTLVAQKVALTLELDQVTEAGAALAGSLPTVVAATGAPVSWYHTLAAQLRFRTGQWADALTEVSAATDAISPEDDTFNVIRSALGLAALVMLRQGNPGPARAQFDKIDMAPANPLNHFGYWVDWADALFTEQDGAPDEALTRLLALFEREFALAERYLGFVVPDLARLAVRTGRVAELAPVARRFAAAPPDRPASVTAAATVLDCVRSGRPAALAAAAARFAGTRHALPAALCHELAAVLHTHQDAAPEAATALRHALTGYQALGAHWDARRARAAVTLSGLAPEPLEQRPVELVLTGSERTVARHAARGLSNTEIGTRLGLTREVVAKHVESIMRKCALDSRLDIADP